MPVVGPESLVFFPRCGCGQLCQAGAAHGQRERPPGPAAAPGPRLCLGEERALPSPAALEPAATATLEHPLRPGPSFEASLNDSQTHFQLVLQLPSIIYQHYRKKKKIKRELCNLYISTHCKNFTSKVSLRTCTGNIRMIFYIFIELTVF